MQPAKTSSIAWGDIRGVIVDLDGTMMDTAPDIHAALNAMRNTLGLSPMSIDVTLVLIGKGTEKLVMDVLIRDLDETRATTLFPRALQTYLDHYRELNGRHAAIYPDVAAGLEHMRNAGLRLACVTNKPIGLAEPLLAGAGLRGFFEVFYGGDSLPRKKPDPYPMLQVCDDFGFAPSEVVAIGDSSNDAIAAREAGCRTLSVPYGYNHGLPVQAIDSDAIVPTLLHAARLLAGR